MKLKCFLVLTVLILCLFLSACGGNFEETLYDGSINTEIYETEPLHLHEYLLRKTVDGTCVEEGYDEFACACGLSYKNIIPSAHRYSEVKDTGGKYTKKICSLCSDYTIVRNQEYVHNVTYEGFDNVRLAVDAQKGVKFYAIALADGTRLDGEIKESYDGNCAYISNANFYVHDTSRTMITQKFVVSVDVKFEKIAEMELLSFAFQNADGKWSYNQGIVKVTADGRFKLYKEEEPLDVKVKSKGYTNIAVVSDPETSLCDVYIDGKLVRENIKYVKFPADAQGCYIRYFDRIEGFSACIDNMKMYVSDTPEFIVPDGLIFKN